MNQVLDKNFYESLLKSQEVEQLRLPLKRQFDTTYFNYVKLYNGNKRTVLTDRPDYISSFYENLRYTQKNVIDIEKLKYDKFFTWDVFKDELTFEEARQFYRIANGITIIKPFDTYMELYYFGAAPENTSACSTYRQNLDFFERFILYFQDRGSKLIEFADRNDFGLLESNNDIQNLSENNYSLLINPSDKFRFVYNDCNSTILLTQKETQCAVQSILQLSAREIAENLKLSIKTVQKHIDTIKNKLQCSSRQKLIQKLLQLEICNLDSNEQGENFYRHKSINIERMEDYFKDTSIKKIHIHCRNKDLHLTEKEAICLLLLYHGHTAKGIANKINCSHRTVEKHIFDVHEKFKISKKSSLIKCAIENGILEMIVRAYPEYVLNL